MDSNGTTTKHVEDKLVEMRKNFDEVIAAVRDYGSATAKPAQSKVTERLARSERARLTYKAQFDAAWSVILKKCEGNDTPKFEKLNREYKQRLQENPPDYSTIENVPSESKSGSEAGAPTDTPAATPKPPLRWAHQAMPKRSPKPSPKPSPSPKALGKRPLAIANDSDDQEVKTKQTKHTPSPPVKYPPTFFDDDDE